MCVERLEIKRGSGVMAWFADERTLCMRRGEGGDVPAPLATPPLRGRSGARAQPARVHARRSSGFLFLPGNPPGGASRGGRQREPSSGACNGGCKAAGGPPGRAPACRSRGAGHPLRWLRRPQSTWSFAASLLESRREQLGARGAHLAASWCGCTRRGPGHLPARSRRVTHLQESCDSTLAR